MDSITSPVQQIKAQQTTSAQSVQTYTKAPTMCEYLRDHIMDELEGAKDYMSKALELKEKYPSWAQKFYKMAEMEIEHANCMNKIFASMSDYDDPCHDSMYKEILGAYTKYMTDVSAMKKMFYS
jgi:hypothetical protein